MKPGIYPGLPFDEYLAIDALNATAIKAAIRRGQSGDRVLSMPDMRRYLEEPSHPSTDPMMFGTFCHVAKLEPLALAGRYAVMPAFHLSPENVTAKGAPTDSKNTTYYRQKVAEFERVNAGKIVVEQAEYDRMLAMMTALRRNDAARECFECDGDTEVTVVAEHPSTGTLLKRRIDKVASSIGRLPDLKTCADIFRFRRAVYDYGYDIGGAMDRMIWELATGETLEPWLVAVESQGAHLVHAAPLGEQALANGARWIARVIDGYCESKRTGVWQAPVLEDAWELPAEDEDEHRVTLTVPGKSETEHPF